MAIVTRANVESILIKRLGALLQQADLDGTTIDGSNADLNDPIRWALTYLNISVVSVMSVADVDLDGITLTTLDKFLDLAEYRTLQTINTQLDDVNIRVGPHSQAYSDLLDHVRKAVDTKKQNLKDDYNIGENKLSRALIKSNFVTHGEQDVIQ